MKQLGQVRGELLLELLQGLTSARLEDLANLTGEGLPDAGEAREIGIFLRQAGKLSGQASNLARPVTVGAHAEGVLAADLQQIGDLLEDPGDIVIVNRHRTRVVAATVRARVAVAVTGSVLCYCTWPIFCPCR